MSNLVATGVVVGVLILTYWLLAMVGRRYVRRMTVRGAESAARARTLWMVLRRVIAGVLAVTGILVIFDVWALSLTPFVAVGTAIAAAIGFGAHGFVRDVLAGFFILAEDQFHVGDTVTIAGATGTVEDVQLRVTVLRDLEGTVHYVPNGQITVTSNSTSRYAQPLIDVPISHQADVDRALAVMSDELTRLTTDPAWSEKIRDQPEMLGVDGLGGSRLVLLGRMTTLPNERWSVRREALLRIKRRFDSEGIDMANLD
jgi:small conductance mechanosensitive channel